MEKKVNKCPQCFTNFYQKRHKNICCSIECANLFKKLSKDKQEESIKKRFLAKINKTNSCWIWTACKNAKGYGIMSAKGKPMMAHRVSWILHNGPILQNKLILHNCPHGNDNPSCVNPLHLWNGTAAQNSSDMIFKNRQKKGNGKYFGQKVKQAKLTNEQVFKIRNLIKKGKSMREIANQFNVNYYSIFDIKRNKTWKRI